MRVGVELSPSACRIVAVDDGRISSRSRGDTEVRSFHVLPASGPDIPSILTKLGHRNMVVVAWGLQGDHLQVVVNDGRYERMRGEAIAAAGAAGHELDDVMADIAPVAPRMERERRRPVALVAVPASRVGSVLKKLGEVRARWVITPALALASLARTRKGAVPAGSIEAYVALEETAACLALVRDGVLLTAREVAWGYLDDAASTGEHERQAFIADRLADELTEFFSLAGVPRDGIVQICICGGMPNLRTMTVPLIERLDLEVETLDSMFAIDMTRLPEPAEEFRERGAELRLAWAAAADWPPPMNLRRDERRQFVRTSLTRGAVVAGIVAGLGVGFGVVRSGRLRVMQANMRPPVAREVLHVPSPASGPRESSPRASVDPVPRAVPSEARGSTTERTPTQVTETARAQVAEAVVARQPAAQAPPVQVPPVVRSGPRDTLRVPESAAVRQPPAAPAPAALSVQPPPPLPTRSEPSVAAQPVAAAPPAVAAIVPRVEPTITRPAAPAPVERTPSRPAIVEPTTTRPAVPDPLERTPGRPAIAEPTPSATSAATAARSARSLETPIRAAAPTRGPAETPAPLRRPEPIARSRPTPPTPFDAALGTILYSSDRKLAVIDGQIVQVGDLVRGARIVEITPTTVLLNDERGRPRQLTLGTPGL